MLSIDHINTSFNKAKSLWVNTDVLNSLKTMRVIWTGLFRFKPVF